MKNRYLQLIVLLSLAAGVCVKVPASIAASGDIAVMVSKNSTVNKISEKELRRLFLGKSIKLPNGVRATLAVYEPLQSEFNLKALERSDAQVSAAWSRLKFTGRGREPRTFDSLELLLDYVANTPEAIAYGLPPSNRPDIKQIYTIN